MKNDKHTYLADGQTLFTLKNEAKALVRDAEEMPYLTALNNISFRVIANSLWHDQYRRYYGRGVGSDEGAVTPKLPYSSKTDYYGEMLRGAWTASEESPYVLERGDRELLVIDPELIDLLKDCDELWESKAGWRQGWGRADISLLPRMAIDVSIHDSTPEKDRQKGEITDLSNLRHVTTFYAVDVAEKRQGSLGEHKAHTFLRDVIGGIFTMPRCLTLDYGIELTDSRPTKTWDVALDNPKRSLTAIRALMVCTAYQLYAQNPMMAASVDGVLGSGWFEYVDNHYTELAELGPYSLRFSYDVGT